MVHRAGNRRWIGLAALLTLGCVDMVHDGLRRRVAGGGGGGGVALSCGEDQPVESAPEPVLGINSVRPSRGTRLGGDNIEIIGFGFGTGDDKEGDQRLRVFFADVEAETTTFVVQENSLRLTTPAYAQAEAVTVRVSRKGETAVLAGGFEYFEPVVIELIAPVAGPSGGGTVITITGKGFVDPTEVQFANESPLIANRIDDEHLQVTTVAMPAGTYPVSVSNINGTDTRPNAFHVFAPVRIDALLPAAGPRGGGTVVRLTGEGLIDPTSVRVAGVVVVPTRGVDDTALTITMPPVSGPGPVDIVVENANGKSTLKNGFVYYSAGNSLDRIVAVLPATGLTGGGQKVHVVVGGFDGVAQDATIIFGSTPASCTAADQFSFTCSAPAGVAGPTDVRVVDSVSGFDVTATDAFTYLALTLSGLQPSRGAIAGGTLVRLLGQGFAAGSRVQVGGSPATEVRFINEGEISFRSPPGVDGAATVQVESGGVTETAASAFEYFDPYNIGAAISGGPIDGCINVTVTDGTRLLPETFVQVGAVVDAERPHLYGFTDRRGQISLCEADLRDLQDVHAGKSGFSGFSWIQIDEADVVIILTENPAPPPDPLPACPQGAGVPPIIRGEVVRIKDEFNPGDDIVRVTTTFGLDGAPLPAPRAEIINEGPYEMIVRAGNLVAIAEAGYAVDNEFEIHALGFNPFLFTEAGSGCTCNDTEDCPAEEECVPLGEASLCTRVYEGVDILVDTPLSRDMVISIPNPPLDPADAEGSKTAAGLVEYSFGNRGFHPLHGFSGAPQDSFTVRMPRRLPASLADVTFTVLADVSSNSPGFPTVQTLLLGLDDTSQGVRVAPMMKLHRDLTRDFPANGPLKLAFDRVPEVKPDVLVTGNVHTIFRQAAVQRCIPAPPSTEVTIHWVAVSPGYVTEFDVPVFPPAAAGANMPSGLHAMRRTSLYVPNANFKTMRGQQWVTRALSGKEINIP